MEGLAWPGECPCVCIFGECVCGITWDARVCECAGLRMSVRPCVSGGYHLSPLSRILYAEQSCSPR